VLGAISLVTLTVGLAIDRGATWVLVAVITGFGALVALGSGLLRKMQARRTPPS
jgi:hypothetical protein